MATNKHGVFDFSNLKLSRLENLMSTPQKRLVRLPSGKFPRGGTFTALLPKINQILIYPAIVSEEPSPEPLSSHPAAPEPEAIGEPGPAASDGQEDGLVTESAIPEPVQAPMAPTEPSTNEDN